IGIFRRLSDKSVKMFQKHGTVCPLGFHTATVARQAQIINAAIAFKRPQRLGFCNSGRQTGQVFLSDRDKMSDSGKLGNRFETTLSQDAGTPKQIDGYACKILMPYTGLPVLGITRSKHKCRQQ
ncbi:hypothetical protein FZA94_000711, partial [Neisseria gonorrhoeae]